MSRSAYVCLPSTSSPTRGAAFSPEALCRSEDGAAFVRVQIFYRAPTREELGGTEVPWIVNPKKEVTVAPSEECVRESHAAHAKAAEKMQAHEASLRKQAELKAQREQDAAQRR